MDEINPNRIKVKEKIKVDRYLCGICQNVLLSPRKCSNCPKHFCNLCSSAYIEINTVCPSCKQTLSLNNAEHYLIEDLSELTIECKNSHLGCKEILMHSVLFDHEENCSFNAEKIEETGGFIDTFVSNNFIKIEKNLNKISNEIKEMKDSNNLSFHNMERKIDLIYEMVSNFFSKNKKDTPSLRDLSFLNEEKNILRENKEKYVNQSSEKHNYEPSINSNIQCNNNIKNYPIEKNNDTPSKNKKKEIESNSIISNKNVNSNIPSKVKKDINNLTQIDIQDKCIFVYFCKGRKKGCKASGDVWGSNPYSCDTDLCRAGLHAGQINEMGGLYIIAYGGPYNNFPSSQKFGIMSNSWEDSQNTHFVVASISSKTFETSKLHFDKCGVYIGECIGKLNGCSQDGIVFGSNPYSQESHRCNSALHSGVINTNGGIFAIHSGGQVSKFLGSTNNGITSEKNGFDSSSFLIKMLK